MHMRYHRLTTVRSAFTIVELLVAVALTILVMTILSMAFQYGMDSVSTLKSIGGLSEQLRSAELVLKRDLESTHLENEREAPVRVSDPQVAGQNWTSPKRGFFKIRQPNPRLQWTPPVGTSPPPPPPGFTYNPNHHYLFEGSENGSDSHRATDHVLQMTTKLSGRSPQEVFLARAPTQDPPPVGAGPGNLVGAPFNLRDFDTSVPTKTQFVGVWAEIAYFLDRQPSALLSTSNNPNTPPLKLYTLYRRQRVLTPQTYSFAPPPYDFKPDQFPNLSVQPVPPKPPLITTTNSPSTITLPFNRLNVDSLPETPFPNTRPVIPFGNADYGTDVLLTNVISFQIRVFTDQGFLDDLPGSSNPREYDTAAGPGTQKPILRAIEIKVRVYDLKNNLTRQITIRQDL